MIFELALFIFNELLYCSWIGKTNKPNFSYFRIKSIEKNDRLDDDFIRTMKKNSSTIKSFDKLLEKKRKKMIFMSCLFELVLKYYEKVFFPVYNKEITTFLLNVNLFYMPIHQKHILIFIR
jgi:hypothetical protein